MAFSNITKLGVRHFIPSLKDVGFRAAKPAVSLADFLPRCTEGYAKNLVSPRGTQFHGLGFVGLSFPTTGMAQPCGCGLRVLPGPGNCSGSSGSCRRARRSSLSHGLRFPGPRRTRSTAPTPLDCRP